MTQRYDLTGQRFNRLVALAPLPFAPGEQTWWLCQCDCGNIKEARTTALLNGGTPSCGCLRSEKIRAFQLNKPRKKKKAK